MQRLDLRTLRYDKFGRSVLIDSKKLTVEISHEALEAFCDRPLDEEEAQIEVSEHVKRLSHLAGRVPSDDGKIIITTNILMNDAVFATKAGG